MTSEETGDEAVVFGDEFVADEILARLPARCAARCTVLSKRFRQLLASPHFWVRHHRLGPPPELPHVVRLYRHDFGMAFEFHVVGPAFAMKHTVDTDRCSYAGTCNGLVLVSSVSSGDQGQFSVEGVVFNPATREDARLSLSLPEPRNKDVERSIMGFGYGPSTKVYKALIREVDFDGHCTRWMVVSLDGSDGQEPRTVFSSCDDDMLCRHSLHTADGKVYFLIFTMYLTGEEGRQHVENWETTSVLMFDVDNEVATSIAVPQGHISDFMMLELHGRPCIYKQKGQDTVIWLLTADHRWERLYVLVNESSQRGDYFAGAWDCGGGLVLAVFKMSGAYLYNLHDEAAAEGDNEGGKRLAAVRSYGWSEQFNDTWFAGPSNLFDYRLTLISPLSIVSDAALSACRPRECVIREQELDKIFLEMTQKLVLGPAMQMLANL